MDHLQQPLELRLVGIDVAAKPLEALGAVEDLTMRIEVLFVIATRQVGKADGRSVVLCIGAQ